nr:Chain D, Peptide [Canis lupus familiaris]
VFIVSVGSFISVLFIVI